MKTALEIEARIQHLQTRLQELSALRDRVAKPDEWKDINSRMVVLIHKINSLQWVIGEGTTD